MIVIAEETSGFRRSGLSPDLRLLIPTFSLPNAPVDFTVGLHGIRNALLPLGGFKKVPTASSVRPDGHDEAVGVFALRLSAAFSEKSF